MTEKDRKFYENMKLSPPIGYCDEFVDRKWETSNRRKQDRASRSRNESFDQSFINTAELDGADEVFEQKLSDEDYCEPLLKKTKYDYVNVSYHRDDDLPFQYRNVRDGQRSVRKEIYVVMSTLS